MSSMGGTNNRDTDTAANRQEVEGTVPSQWWLDLRIERDRLRSALAEVAEITSKPSPLGDRSEVHRIAQEALDA